jgi:hypothetical protein
MIGGCGGWRRGGLIAERSNSGESGQLGFRLMQARRFPYVSIRIDGSNKVHVIIIRNHSLGLSALDPLPSAFEIDVEEDPVVDVCRRSERRDRSPVLF